MATHLDQNGPAGHSRCARAIEERPVKLLTESHLGCEPGEHQPLHMSIAATEAVWKTQDSQHISWGDEVAPDIALSEDLQGFGNEQVLLRNLQTGALRREVAVRAARPSQYWGSSC